MQPLNIMPILFAAALLSACSDSDTPPKKAAGPTADETVAFILLRMEDGGSYDYQDIGGTHHITVKHQRGTDTWGVDDTYTSDTNVKSFIPPHTTVRIVAKEDCVFEITEPWPHDTSQVFYRKVDMSRYLGHEMSGVFLQHNFSGQCPVTFFDKCQNYLEQQERDDIDRLNKAIAYFKETFCRKNNAF